MKNKLTLLVGTVLVGWMTWGCSPEYIQTENDNGNGTPSLAGSEAETHPALETVCQSSDTIFLMSEDGSDFVNKCYGANGQIPCSNGNLKWGYVIMREGYYGGTGYVDCEFTMAPGWYGEGTQWKVGSPSSFAFDPNGIPTVEADWSAVVTNPCENRWILRFPTHSLPSGSFDIMMMVHGVRLNIWGATNTSSQTHLWAKNPHYDDPANAMFSATSSLMMHFTPQNCGAPAPAPTSESICTTLKVGAPALGTCTTIVPNTSGLSGTLSYSWSTGATSATLSVCPTATTTYTVTVSSDGHPALISDITVNVMDVKCGNSNGNNPHHKVYVCHVPPGNPSNAHEICIDWSGVPAHVASYRPAGSTQGHDSGCEIGRCGSNPCL